MAVTPYTGRVPSRDAPDTFAQDGNDFLAWLGGLFVSQLNESIAALNLNSTTDASGSSVAIGTGAKSFAVSAGKSWQPGMYLVIADAAAGSTNSMWGQVTSYADTTLTVAVMAVRGSGTKSAWVISQSAPGGAAPGDNNDITKLLALTDVPTVIASAINAAVASRVGTIFYVPGTAAPTGSIKANGTLLSRTGFAALWAYAQASGNLVADGAWQAGKFSTGDGSTNFRIPDLRGEFIRGWDDSRGVDASRSIGSYQADALQNITGTLAQGGIPAATGVFGNSGSFWGVGADGQTNYTASFDASRVARTAAETRPRNVALTACIWFS